MTTVSDEDLRGRLKQVEQLIDRLRMRLSVLEKDRTNLQIALQIVEGFGAWSQTERYDLDGRPESPPAPKGAEARKPAGTPPMSEMIYEVLASAQMFDEGPMEPKAIAAKIRMKWWPDAPYTSVGPVAWRMWKEGRLEKVDAAYRIPEEETPAAATAGASEPELVPTSSSINTRPVEPGTAERG